MFKWIKTTEEKSNERKKKQLISMTSNINTVEKEAYHFPRNWFANWYMTWICKKNRWFQRKTASKCKWKVVVYILRKIETEFSG